MYAQSQAELVKKLEDAGSSMLTGTCVGYDWVNSLVSVNVDGSVLSMPWDGPSPWRGQKVRVTWAAGQPVARMVHGSAMGSVVSVASGLAVVLGDDGHTYSGFVVADGLTVSPADRVRLDHGGRAISFRYPVEPAGSDFEVPGAPPSSGGSFRFVPSESGSWKDGDWRSGLVEMNAGGSGRMGVYYYGDDIPNTIPAGATLIRAELELTEAYDEYPGTATPLGTHGNASSAGGVPSLSGFVNVADGGLVNILPIAGAFLSGAKGVGFAAGYGYRAFAAAPGSGALRLEWTV